MSSEALTLVKQMYDAFAAHDPDALARPLDEGFIAEVAPGMPYDMGGVHRGRQTVLRTVWAVADTHYDICPVPDAYVTATGGTVVATGLYRGMARGTGRSVDAEFAHIWRVHDGRIVHLHQYTDTARWRDALN